MIQMREPLMWLRGLVTLLEIELTFLIFTVYNQFSQFGDYMDSTLLCSEKEIMFAVFCLCHHHIRKPHKIHSTYSYSIAHRACQSSTHPVKIKKLVILPPPNYIVCQVSTSAAILQLTTSTTFHNRWKCIWKESIHWHM